MGEGKVFSLMEDGNYYYYYYFVNPRYIGHYIYLFDLFIFISEGELTVQQPRIILSFHGLCSEGVERSKSARVSMMVSGWLSRCFIWK